MSTIDSLLLALFHRLRQGGAPLGVGEYLLAVRTLRAGYGLDRPEHLHSTCRLLWARSCEDQELFDLTYAELVEFRLRPRPIAPHPGRLLRLAQRPRLPRPAIPRPPPRPAAPWKMRPTSPQARNRPLSRFIPSPPRPPPPHSGAPASTS